MIESGSRNQYFTLENRYAKCIYILEQRKAERLDRRNRNRTIAMVAGVAIFAVAAFLIYKVITGDTNFTGEIDTQFPLDDAKITSSGLVYKDLVSGEGPAAKAGDTVSIIYTGYLPDGQIFRFKCGNR